GLTMCRKVLFKRRMRRKHISWKTKCAAALLCVRYDPPIPYDDVKKMTEDQFLSLFHWDHNILHTNNAVDEFWNLTPMLISAHRENTNQDAKNIAKSKRIRFHGMKDKKRKIRSRGFDKTLRRKMDGTVTRREK